MYNIVTSFNEQYWLEIAKNNVLSIDAYWPKNYKINLYHQLRQTEDISSRVHWYDLYQSCPELLEFIERWKEHPKANGQREKKNGFRWNAIKFCHKTFAIWHQAKIQSNGWLIWLDCDVIIKKQIDNNFLTSICPGDKTISFMGRPGKYSECGFIGFNLDHPQSKVFLKEWEDLYLSGKFIELAETHDSWTFDWLRKQKDSSLFFNVNEQALTNKNPFSQSLLGPFMAHAKGDNKVKQTNRIIKNIN